MSERYATDRKGYRISVFHPNTSTEVWADEASTTGRQRSKVSIRFPLTPHDLKVAARAHVRVDEALRRSRHAGAA